MVIKKCHKCKKNITKKAPGIECSRCEVIVHADPSCAKLSNKQLNTLRNSSSIEWSCEDCQKNVSRRSSIITPDEDEDEDDSESVEQAVRSISVKKLVADISREVKKTFKEEISHLESSLDFVTEQLTNMEQSIKKQNELITNLEHKNQDLQNRNKNLELRVSVMEQEIQTFEQKSLCSSLEVAGLPEIAIKDVSKILETLANKLELNNSEIQYTQRLPGSKDKPGPLLIELKSKSAKKQWIDASKEKCLTVGQIIPDVSKEIANHRVYIREALTKYMKTLLYNTKAQLSKSFQFIWCKDGKVFVRKNNNSKIHYIKSQEDITKLCRNPGFSTPL